MKQDKLNISVREERPEDFRRVEEITKEAFSYPGRIEQGGIGCPYEHWMVHELRNRDGILSLSLVAEIDDTIVGHIICSHAAVQLEDKSIPVLNFGPLSVLPQYQRKGVGAKLLKTMIAKAKTMGFGAILFFGRPEYYPQFGFVEAAKFGITDCNGANYPAFMAMELQPGYLINAMNGKYYESDIYDDEKNREAVIKFDRRF